MTKNELMHFGIKGMKWGVRRYQNKDGTLTPAGKKRYDRDIIAGGHKILGKYRRRQENSMQKNINSIQQHRNEMLNSNKKKKLFTEKDIDDMLYFFNSKMIKYKSKADKHEQLANSILREIGNKKINEL